MTPKEAFGIYSAAFLQHAPYGSWVGPWEAQREEFRRAWAQTLERVALQNNHTRDSVINTLRRQLGASESATRELLNERLLLSQRHWRQRAERAEERARLAEFEIEEIKKRERSYRVTSASFSVRSVWLPVYPSEKIARPPLTPDDVFRRRFSEVPGKIMTEDREQEDAIRTIFQSPE